MLKQHNLYARAAAWDERREANRLSDLVRARLLQIKNPDDQLVRHQAAYIRMDEPTRKAS